MEVVQVAQYQSDTLDEEAMEEHHGVNGNKRTSKKKKWKFWVKKEVFDTATEVEASVKKQWSKHYTYLVCGNRK